MVEIGIIGFGRFGQFMASILSKDNDVSVYNRSDKSIEAKRIGVKWKGIDEVASKEVVILSVPMREMEKTLENIKEKVKENALILDVCSIKEFSCKLMKKILPKYVEIIGTHPLFGPNSVSAETDLKGLKIALCNVRSKRIGEVKKFCEGLGLKVHVVSPKEHDKQMAYSQSLTHFIGHSVKEMKLKRVELGTKSFEMFMDVMDIFKKHGKELFEDIETMNPYVREARKKMLNEMIGLDRKLRKLKK